MITLLVAIVTFIVGAAVAFFFAGKKSESKKDELLKENDRLKTAVAEADKRVAIAEAKSEEYKKAQEREKELCTERLAKEAERAKENLERQEKKNTDMLEQMKEHHDKELKAMESRFRELATEVLKMRAEELKRSNEEQIMNIVAPVKDGMSKVEKAVQDARISSAAQKAEVEKAIEGLASRTLEIGMKADNLACALKDNGKVQGDWGELLLESILEESGLRKDHEYLVQENVKDEEGNNLRPDVIVKCPGDKRVVVDSKVSITAYYNYTHAKDEEEMRKFEKENLNSVRKHVDELAAKRYDKLVGNTISHVLMFIPNEGSYILAMRTDPRIGDYAFKKGVIIINPTNLMLALQLIYNLWQSERQSRNIENIIKQSSELYDKFVTFAENFGKVEDALRSAQKTLETARGQLNTGKGNIVRRLENLKSLGVTPKKSIPQSLTDEDSGSEPAE